MWALKLYGKNDIRLVDVPIPAIENDEILLRTDAAAICGTDVRMWQYGRSGVDEGNPLTLGHEFVGTIVKAGSAVPAFYKEGMCVALQPNIGCGICDRCVRGQFHLCDTYQAFGINMDGAFAEYIKIPAAAVARGNLTVLPAGVSKLASVVAEPLSCAYNGFQKCSVSPGESALVVGAGPIGMCHALLLHMAGARVLLHDVREDRLASSRALIPFADTYCGNALGEFVQEWTQGRGLDVAIVACPVPAVQSAVLPLMNYGGRVNYFGGVPQEKQPVAIDTNLIHYKELYVTGSTRSSIAQFRKIMELIHSGVLCVESLVTHQYTIHEAMQAFENAQSAVGMKHVFVFDTP